MAILPLAKVTLLGTTKQKDVVLDELQDLGCLHLIDLGQSEPGYGPVVNISDETRQALRYLRTCPIRRRPTPHDPGFHPKLIIRRTLENAERQEELRRQRDELVQAIEQLRPWGEFQRPEDTEFGALRFWFYVIPQYKLRQLEDLDLTWQVAARDQHAAYVIVIAADEPQQMPVAHVHLDARPLSTLKKMLETAESELEDLHWQ
ncbi:MAG: hypothetical protein KDA85_05655, partial [Planctomycetaceae bacterium]|nr:hypothetical protein [Planctomycetaceae bacterium]